MPNTTSDNKVRHDWTVDEATALYQQPFADLLYQAQHIFRMFFNPNEVQISTLLSVKTGRCPEDCRYCSQSAHFKTPVESEKLLDVAEVVTLAQRAKDKGATRFCMGGAWRSPPKKTLPKLVEMIEQVKALGLETCLTAGMLSQAQADELKAAGLDYYNHNLDTAPEYYANIVTTHTFQDRLDTLEAVRNADIKVCCGGILGMGETQAHRISFLIQLANLKSHPQSVPLNCLVPIPGTPLSEAKSIDPISFVRLVALARIMLPHSRVRLSAGRNAMSDELQALCFLAGANSIHYGEKLLTTPLPAPAADQNLFAALGINASSNTQKTCETTNEVV